MLTLGFLLLLLLFILLFLFFIRCTPVLAQKHVKDRTKSVGVQVTAKHTIYGRTYRGWGWGWVPRVPDPPPPPPPLRPQVRRRNKPSSCQLKHLSEEVGRLHRPRTRLSSHADGSSRPRSDQCPCVLPKNVCYFSVIYPNAQQFRKEHVSLLGRYKPAGECSEQVPSTRQRTSSVTVENMKWQNRK